MSKKTILLALTVAALFAIPSATSAQEIHISGVSEFTGNGFGSSFTTSGEPTINCNTTTVNSGRFDLGSTTTGFISFNFNGCTAEFLGATPSCNSSSGSFGTIRFAGAFHLITISSGKPGILMTPTATTIICAGFSNITTGGNVLGTITSPRCGESSYSIYISINSTGVTQEHGNYTGSTQHLTARTGSGTANPTGLNTGTVALSAFTSGTLECT